MWGSTAIGLGESITKFDAQLAAFQPALALIEEFLKDRQHQGPIYIFNNIKATIPKFADTRPGPYQPTTLTILCHSDHLLRTNADLTLRIAWHNPEDDREPVATTKRLALEVIRNTTDPNQNPQTINFQRQQAKMEATQKWEAQWYENPRTSLAYRTACTKLPDGKIHPILRAQQRKRRYIPPIETKRSHV